MGWKLIFCVLFVSSAIVSNGVFAKSSRSLRTMTKVTEVYDKMLMQPFYGHGRICSKAQADAMDACSKWTKDSRKNLGATNVWCRRNSCECSVNPYSAKTVCLGTVVYEASTAYKTDRDGNISGTRRGKAVATNPVAKAEGTGISCEDAKYEAKEDLFDQLKDMSDEYDVMGIGDIICHCKREPGTAETTAKCGVTVKAEYRAAVAFGRIAE